MVSATALDTIVAFVAVVAAAAHPLYGLPGQPEPSSQSSTKCDVDATCVGNRIIKPGLFSTNDGPAPYDLELPENSPQPLGSSAMGQVYNDVGFSGVRNDESGMAFDVRCMFPDPNKDPDVDENWNWTASDLIFNATVQAGLAPLLKIPVFEWNSPRITGLSYVDSMGQPQYVINPENFGDCPAWPAYAPFMVKIGSKLALKIVDRYNANGMLNATAWTSGLAGVELMNEWAGSSGADPRTICRDWCLMVQMPNPSGQRSKRIVSASHGRGVPIIGMVLLNRPGSFISRQRPPLKSAIQELKLVDLQPR